MDEARRVLERLARIEELERERVSADRLLGELRELVLEAEAWARAEHDPVDAIAVVARCGAALEAGNRAEVALLAQ